MDKHPITPSPELVEEWATVNGTHYEDLATLCRQVAIQAAQWGANMELEACLANTYTMYGKDKADWLRAMRRPKPPSLKEQALLQLDTLNADLAMHGMGCDLSQIRRALEALPE
jgi:hypothetical protein